MANETNKAKQKFFEVIKPNHNFEFVGRMNLFLGMSLILVVLSIAMLPINHFLRGNALNYAIDFRGGSEIQVQFERPEEPAKIRAAMQKGGFQDTEVLRVRDDRAAKYILRFGAVSTVNEEKKALLEQALKAKFGADTLRKLDFSEGGDKMYVYFTKGKTVELQDIVAVYQSQGVKSNTVQRFGRPDDNVYEVILVGLNIEVKAALDSGLGENTQVEGAESVGPKAGKELRDDGVKSLGFAIIFIMIYIAIRFDFRYGPGTVVALLHDAIVVMGTFAVTYKEFSLTTVAAILTVIGYSMNDTIVVFDRIREDASRLRDKKFDRVVNTAINETLSRTILTSLTVFLVTLAMYVLGTGVIRDFAFAMNVGVIVGTYSSIFVAAPILLWLNRKYFAPTGGKSDGKNTVKPAVKKATV
jgi:preprotein translocase subunit SecF